MDIGNSLLVRSTRQGHVLHQETDLSKKLGLKLGDPICSEDVPKDAEFGIVAMDPVKVSDVTEHMRRVGKTDPGSFAEAFGLDAGKFAAFLNQAAPDDDFDFRAFTNQLPSAAGAQAA